jgi:hypothetical protein
MISEGGSRRARHALDAAGGTRALVERPDSDSSRKRAGHYASSGIRYQARQDRAVQLNVRLFLILLTHFLLRRPCVEPPARLTQRLALLKFGGTVHRNIEADGPAVLGDRDRLVGFEVVP